MSIPFLDRHNGPRRSEIEEMLRIVGAESIEELTRQTVPADILLDKLPYLDNPIGEQEYLANLKAIVSKNKRFRSLIGMGFYGTGILPVVMRNIFESPGWYTSYTPYQAEVSQGRLEALLNFQTMISSLTGFKMSNCSLLDESTGAAEAVRMMYELRSRDAQKAGKNIVFVDENIFPQVLAVIRTRCEAIGIKVITGDCMSYVFDEMCFGAVLQYPAANGEVRDYAGFCEKAHGKSILVTAVVDLLALALFKEPALWGADIAVGSAQRFGLPMGFGGPTTGFMATRDEYKRSMPGRIIGVSVDRLGKPALRMALQTREQHIKRDKATSNICTASALMAVMSGMYAVYHGPKGVRKIAQTIYVYAHLVAEELKNAGFVLAVENFFDTIEIIGVNVQEIKAKAEVNKINFCYPRADVVRMSFDELSDLREVIAVLEIFGIVPDGIGIKASGEIQPHHSIYMKRESNILTEPVFGKYHSETEMMRYIKKLERRDISLTHSMIPLGSCTMKLNAAVEMMPLSWSELTDMHPLVPEDQAEGYIELLRDLEKDLAIITGFDACSLQPTSGASGEYAGLLTIRKYHSANGNAHRNIAIIPASAHGTNPASAVMAGMEVVIVTTNEKGNINVDELRLKAVEHKDRLSCMMITYPSTHGVFESEIREIVRIIHDNGGLVFMDGANMNAQVGLTNPGFIGADVCHLNLHKTFAMPHGGGGPGLGPICVSEKLKPYLPCHPFLHEHEKNRGVQAVSSAPYGYPLLAPITHAYIKLLGAEGLKKATQIAILNANYISISLKNEFRTLYSGETGRVAHECILDLREFRREYGIDATDVAKRLMDFGYHAPTLSFPVVETLMVEPTESESKVELDRFIEVLRTIKKECEEIKAGVLDSEDNPLKNAPHTAIEVAADVWKHKYGREQAAYPLGWIRENKFWPHVSRVDNGYGDRNLVTVNDNLD